MEMGSIVGISIGTAAGVGPAAFYLAVRLLPHLIARNGNGNGSGRNASQMSPEYWDVRIQANMEKSIENKLVPLLERQTQILERMERNADRMTETLVNNTLALQIVQKLQEQRPQHRGGM